MIEAAEQQAEVDVGERQLVWRGPLQDERFAADRVLYARDAHWRDRHLVHEVRDEPLHCARERERIIT